jgi:hypothetical protein
MLINNQLIGFGAGGVEDTSLLGIATKLGLTSGLKGVYDLGDIRCYDGVATQTLADSNAADDFHFGGTSASAGDDPTFNGTPGDLSSAEYASTDGGDLFRVKSQPTWVQPFHKNNALFSCCGYFQVPNVGGSVSIWGDCGAVSAVGATMYLDANEKFTFVVQNGSGNAFALASTAAFSIGTPVFFGLRVDEAANTITMDIDGTQETNSCTYSSPSASSAAYDMELMARGNGTGFLPNTSRLYEIAFWEGVALTTTNLSDLKTEMDKRFA